MACPKSIFLPAYFLPLKIVRRTTILNWSSAWEEFSSGRFLPRLGPLGNRRSFFAQLEAQKKTDAVSVRFSPPRLGQCLVRSNVSNPCGCGLITWVWPATKGPFQKNIAPIGLRDKCENSIDYINKVAKTQQLIDLNGFKPFHNWPKGCLRPY